MNCSRLVHLLLALAVVTVSLAALLAAAAAAAADSGVQDQVGQQAPKQIDSARNRFKLPKIFDFEQYKQLFKKTYRSLAEEMVRRKLMLARAFRAWISSIKYKYRKLSYYLAINHMSDWTNDELDMMENKKLAAATDTTNAPQQQVVNVVDEAQLDQVLPQVDPSHIEEDLDRLANEGQFGRLVEGELDHRSPVIRRKRSVSRPKARQRTLSMESLINTGAGVQLGPAAAKRVDPHPTSNNPDYEAPELVSYGVRDDNVEEIRELLLTMPRNPPQLDNSTRPNAQQANLLGTLMQSLSSFVAGQGPEEEQQLPDEMFFDHRDSGCLFLPRHQGKCGSCWAYSTIAFAEWLYCQATGKLVAFSEQYMVDCGQSAGAHGCAGGSEQASVKFLHNFGVELRQSYPYVARDNQCPYDEHTHPKQMGFIRMELGAMLSVPVATFEKYLRFSPIVIAIKSKKFPGIYEYGGGVIEGIDCDQQATHSILLVGHGREDGQEYWLIRNSWSIGWGDGGYMKMAKSCGEMCIADGHGFIFGTDNGRKFTKRPQDNQRNNRSVVADRYRETMLLNIDGAPRRLVSLAPTWTGTTRAH